MKNCVVSRVKKGGGGGGGGGGVRCHLISRS